MSFKRAIKCLVFGMFLTGFINASLYAKPHNMTVAVGWNKPPYVLSKDDSGFELELVRAVFGLMGYQIKPIYVPYGRTKKLLQRGQVDAAMTLSANSGIRQELLSKSYISYQNVAISLKTKGIKIEKIDDLANHTVVAFQNSAKSLGSIYAKAVSSAPYYQELPDQSKQVGMLLQGNMAVAVMDINIFIHLSRERTGQSQLDNVDVHNIFADTQYSVGFSSQALREAFDQALKQYQNSQHYLELVNRYEFKVRPLQP